MSDNILSELRDSADMLRVAGRKAPAETMDRAAAEIRRLREKCEVVTVAWRAAEDEIDRLRPEDDDYCDTELTECCMECRDVVPENDLGQCQLCNELLCDDCFVRHECWDGE